MQKLFLIFWVLCCVGCSASRDNATRENIRKEYASKKSKTKSSTGKKSTDSKKNNLEEKEKLVATSNVTVAKTSVEDYINTYKIVAMENMKTYGIPASIKLAQGILESGSGSGKLCREANNHFGIKCKDTWTGEYVFFTDDAPDECFRKYNSPLESYNDHSEFLVNRAYYRNLFSLDKRDYVAWAKGLKNAGYATDPKYPDKIISIIERYKLYEYDKKVLGNDYTYVAPKLEPSSFNNLYDVRKGDTLYSISNSFGMTVDELKMVNNISNNNISVGQTLKVK